LLRQYPWPGNVRELKNVVRRAVLLSGDGVINPAHMDFLVGDKARFEDVPAFKDLSGLSLKEVEKIAIRQTLELTKGNKSKAASILQIDYKTLLTKIKEYNIK
ncbi:MAG: sigma-54-dependent Fis family transcriptional regulator, partial [Nitrospirae bacterium]|nr:sigma-54-dependent Fis family transcriptional regulator [Nitrospirota bacterium]